MQHSYAVGKEYCPHRTVILYNYKDTQILLQNEQSSF